MSVKPLADNWMEHPMLDGMTDAQKWEWWCRYHSTGLSMKQWLRCYTLNAPLYMPGGKPSGGTCDASAVSHFDSECRHLLHHRDPMQMMPHRPLRELEGYGRRSAPDNPVVCFFEGLEDNARLDKYLSNATYFLSTVEFPTSATDPSTWQRWATPGDGGVPGVYADVPPHYRMPCDIEGALGYVDQGGCPRLHVVHGELSDDAPGTHWSLGIPGVTLVTAPDRRPPGGQYVGGIKPILQLPPSTLVGPAEVDASERVGGWDVLVYQMLSSSNLEGLAAAEVGDLYRSDHGTVESSHIAWSKRMLELQLAQRIPHGWEPSLTGISTERQLNSRYLKYCVSHPASAEHAEWAARQLAVTHGFRVQWAGGDK